MSKIIEARLSNEFIDSVGIPGIIHSKFHKVLNILFKMPAGDNRLITFITPDTKGIPDSITISVEYFAKITRLPIGHRLIFNKLNICFETVSEPLTGDIWCLRQSGLIIRKTEGQTKFPLYFPHHLKEMDSYTIEYCYNDSFFSWSSTRKREIVLSMQDFVKCWLKHDILGMETILLRYIGLGIGLTPSCDDLFLGIIAVLSGAKLYAEVYSNGTTHGLSRWKNLLSIGNLTPFDKLLFNRTTDVSLKYLCCAQEGCFSNVIIDLIREIFSNDKEPLKDCLEAVSLVGHSSGRDMLLGVDIACHELGKSIGVC